MGLSLCSVLSTTLDSRLFFCFLWSVLRCLTVLSCLDMIYEDVDLTTWGKKKKPFQARGSNSRASRLHWGTDLKKTAKPFLLLWRFPTAQFTSMILCGTTRTLQPEQASDWEWHWWNSRYPNGIKCRSAITAAWQQSEWPLSNEEEWKNWHKCYSGWV